MSKIIKNGEVIPDDWPAFRLQEGQLPETAELPRLAALFPLAVWQARRTELSARIETVGVWLSGASAPEEIAGDLGRFRVVGIDFPKFSDGRGYSIARLLRERLRFTGEIRAIGDVLRDQLFLMKRCGFDSFAIRPDKDPQAALAGLSGFSETYQGDACQPLPLFRRRPG